VVIILDKTNIIHLDSPDGGQFFQPVGCFEECALRPHVLKVLMFDVSVTQIAL
jgi:hypothetical protein